MKHNAQQESIVAHEGLAVVLATQVSGSHAEIDLLLPPDLVFFSGHFPGQPILPGVAQLHLAVNFGKALLGAGGQFTRMSALKFRVPLRPNDRVRLVLDWSPGDGVLRFEFRLRDEKASGGRIHFAP